MKLKHTCSIVALSFASVALAQQDGTFPPQGPGPGGQQGERPRQPIDPQQFIDRMMQNDANGDGMLSKDELPPALADRLMERADTNKDGSIDRGELEAAAKSGAMGGARGGQREGGRPGAEGGMNIETSMKQLNRAYKALGNSNLDASSRSADLGMIQSLQAALIASKGAGERLKMSDAAKAKFGEDRAKFDAEFRGMMLETLLVSIELEKAVLEGDSAKAKSLVTKLHDMEEKGHELFQPSEGSSEGDRGGRGENAPPPGGQPGQPPRGGRGGRGQGGQGQSGRPQGGAPNGS
ncbi:MAG: hypothetical protein RLY21_2479 [Planctomycetota bacterium]